MARNKISKNVDEEELANLYNATFSSNELPQNADEKITNNKPDGSIDPHIIAILKQRHKQRDRLLEFLIALTAITVGFFALLVLIRILTKIFWDIDLVSDGLLGTIAVSMFAEIIAVIRGITKALWSEKDIMESSIIEKMHDDQKPSDSEKSS